MPMLRLLTCLLLLLAACERSDEKRAATDIAAARDTPQVLLSGRFQSVGKTARGRVELVARGDDYSLHLYDVHVEYDGPVHVYLVGAPRAPDTKSVDEAVLKFDMAPLQNGAKQQIIELPSAPNPSLRSVVLWNPKYSANLAQAPLVE